MANGLARINFIGNLGADPKAGQAKNGNTTSRFRVGCTVWALGEDRTTWYTVIVFGKQAEFINDNATKGTQVAVDGVPWEDSFQGNDGEVKYISVLADQVKLLGGKNGNGGNGGGDPNRSSARSSSSRKRQDDDEENMPF